MTATNATIIHFFTFSHPLSSSRRFSLYRRTNRLSSGLETLWAFPGNRRHNTPLQRLGITQLLTEFFQAVLQHPLDMTTGASPSIRKVQNLSNILKLQPQGLCFLHE
jgi:hypothetical protein